MNVQTLRERKAELAAAVARHVYEPPEAAELRQTETALRDAERAEEEAHAREMTRRAEAARPEMERTHAATRKALGALVSAIQAEQAVREDVASRGISIDTPPAVPLPLAAMIARLLNGG